MADIYRDQLTGIYLPDSARPQAKGYSEAGASHMRRALRGFIAQSGSAQEDIDWNNYTLRQRGRMLTMASPVAAGAINTNRTHVVGVGLQLRSRIDREVLGLSPEAAKRWQWDTEREWELWASKKRACDATGVNNFYSMQQLVLKSWLTSGDVFALIHQKKPTSTEPYSLRLQVIEADRISTPNTVGVLPGACMTEGKTKDGNVILDGVEVDREASIIAYHLCSTYPFEATAKKREWVRVEAYGKNTGQPNILHVMESERAGQYRGVTYLAPVIEELLQLRRYTESELMAALIQSFFTAWITTKSDPAKLPFGNVGAQEVSLDENDYEMGPGTVNVLRENEEITFGNPNIPTAGFGAFVESICTQIGAALEVPPEVLLKKFTNNYSASRAALMLAWDAFRMRRQWLVDDFCQPTYEVWLAEAVARGRIAAPGFWSDPKIRAAWCGASWIGPAQGQLDPVKEVKANILSVNHGFKTHEEVTVELGGRDWEDNAEQLARENELLRKVGGGTRRVEDAGDGEEEEHDEKKGDEV